MATKSSRLDNRVASLFGRGNSVTQVWQKIKRDPTTKHTTNKAIQASIDRYSASRQAAKDLSKAKSNQPVNKVITSAGGKVTATKQVGFQFWFEFGMGSSSGKLGKQKVGMVIDVSGNPTKQEIRNKIADEIRDWIERNYGVDAANNQRLVYQITFIQGV